MKLEKITRDFIKTLTEPQKKRTKAYDTKGIVTRIEEGIAWVKLAGSKIETPLQMTISAEPGDVVQCRIGNGTGWLTGNDTAPPTDDKFARVSYRVARAAKDSADEAQQSADNAYGHAETAYALAQVANETADKKNRVYRQNTKPTGGTYSDGDLWFDTANDNAIYRYSTTDSDFVAVALGDDAIDNLSANKLTAGSIDASVIVVSNLDAGNITTGTMIADFIRGGTLLLGGNNNSNGVLYIKNSNNNTIVEINNRGIYADYSASKHTRIDKAGARGINYHGVSAYDVNHQLVYDGYEAEAVSLEGDLQFYEKHSTSNFDYDGALDESGWIICRYNLPNGGYYMSFAAGNDSIFYISQNGTYKIHLTNSTEVTGNFVVSGSKSRLAETEDYSKRLLYCYETPTPMFGDIGEGLIGDDGLTYIFIDPIFAETIDQGQYQVFLQKYNNGDAYVSERTRAYFIVSGTPGLAFGWEIKAKQKGYSERRLDDADLQFSIDAENYGQSAANHIQHIAEERSS